MTVSDLALMVHQSMDECSSSIEWTTPWTDSTAMKNDGFNVQEQYMTSTCPSDSYDKVDEGVCRFDMS